MGFLIRVALVALAGLLACLRQLAPTHTIEPSPQNHVLEGNEFYYAGRPRRAVEAYSQALKIDPGNLNARLNGAVVLNDLGDHAVAAIWYGEAVRLKPGDGAVRTAYGETLMTLSRDERAEEHLGKALELDRNAFHTWTAWGRLKLAQNKPEEAAVALKRAIQLEPNFTLAHFYLGRARERLGDDNGALEAYQAAAFKDSYFADARYHLSRTLARLSRFQDAHAQAAKLLSAAPVHENYRKLEHALRLRISGLRRGSPKRAQTAPLEDSRASRPGPKDNGFSVRSPATGEIPLLRIGIGTNGMGRPLSWTGLAFTPKADFSIVSARWQGASAAGRAGERWTARVASGRIVVANAAGKRVLTTRSAIRLRTSKPAAAWTYLKELPGRGSRGLGRTLRGDVELSLHPESHALKVVNIVDLESYTQGVLTAEMPIASPVEALKAQAVIARTHALFVKGVRPRHPKDGYQLCDGQHCQVYYGVGSETEKSKSVVAATRGRVVTHKGRVAEMLYSSNCGGHSQSSGDLKGWSPVPYFSAARDAEDSVEIPASPWELRRWLLGRPDTFCRPSKYVYASHYRWSRVVPAEDMHKRINRTIPVGTVLGILPLKRSSSGHLNSVLIRGARGSRRIDNEMSIRGLFGVGSQRSALFVMDTEYDERQRPLNYIFYGGGWGHGVGMCQSGAMGRAERGQSYATILKAYYSGIEIGNQRY